MVRKGHFNDFYMGRKLKDTRAPEHVKRSNPYVNDHPVKGINVISSLVSGLLVEEGPIVNKTGHFFGSVLLL